MKLWPFRQVSFETSLSPVDALARLHADIGAPRNEFMLGPLNSTVGSNCERRPFYGLPLPDGALVSNNLNSEPGELRRHNSFQARTRVRITSSPIGSRVDAAMRLRRFIEALVLLWCIVAVLGAVLIALGTLTGEASVWAVLAGPGLLLAFMWLLTSFAFSEDAETMERMLRITLERG